MTLPSSEGTAPQVAGDSTEITSAPVPHAVPRALIVAAVLSVAALLLQVSSYAERARLEVLTEEVVRARDVEGGIDRHREVVAGLAKVASVRLQVVTGIDELARGAGAHVVELTFSDPVRVSTVGWRTDVTVVATGGDESLTRLLSGMVDLAPGMEVASAAVSPSRGRSGLPMLEVVLTVVAVDSGGSGV